MRVDDLAPGAFTAMFKELALAYQRTIPAADVDPTIDVYYKTIRVFPAPIVERAMTIFREHPSRFFPRAPDLAAKCRELEGEEKRRRRHQHQAEELDRCGECGKAFYVVGYECGNGVVVGRRRCDCPHGGQGWDTPAARAFREPPTVGTDEWRRLTLPSAPTETPETLWAKRSAFHQAPQLARP